MKTTVKLLALVFLGSIIWSTFIYIAMAFIKGELNPFIWAQSSREIMVFLIFCYFAFSPLIVGFLKNEMI
jgi:hypothetical protein